MRKVTTGPGGNHLDVIREEDGKLYRNGGLLTNNFKYVDSRSTDIRKTFAKARRLAKKFGSI